MEESLSSRRSDSSPALPKEKMQLGDLGLIFIAVIGYFQTGKT
jgi:hypothetical protein